MSILIKLLVLVGLVFSLQTIQVTNRPHIRVRNGLSNNWAGYAVQTSLNSPQSGVVSDVSGQWTIPTVSCLGKTSTYSSAWVGIDGYSNGTVEQTGIEQDCINGRPNYRAWFEMYPHYSRTLRFSVKAGDTLK